MRPLRQRSPPVDGTIGRTLANPYMHSINHRLVQFDRVQVRKHGRRNCSHQLWVPLKLFDVLRFVNQSDGRAKVLGSVICRTGRLLQRAGNCLGSSALHSVRAHRRNKWGYQENSTKQHPDSALLRGEVHLYGPRLITNRCSRLACRADTRHLGAPAQVLHSFRT